MKTLFRIAVAMVFVLLILAGQGIRAAQAQEPRLLDSHRDWHTYTFQENGNLVCYMASKPTREEGEYTQRGDVYMLVTHRPADATRDIANINAGYTYQADSQVTVKIGDNSFDFMTQEGTAWSQDAEMDRALISAMKAGTSMVVQGTSSRGTLTTDTFSLLGFTAAYNEITRTCGL